MPKSGRSPGRGCNHGSVSEQPLPPVREALWRDLSAEDAAGLVAATREPAPAVKRFDYNCYEIQVDLETRLVTVYDMLDGDRFEHMTLEAFLADAVAAAATAALLPGARAAQHRGSR